MCVIESIRFINIVKITLVHTSYEMLEDIISQLALDDEVIRASARCVQDSLMNIRVASSGKNDCHSP